MWRLVCLLCSAAVLLLLSGAAAEDDQWTDCHTSDALDHLKTSHAIDLTPLNGSWETVHFRQSVGEQQGDIPSFFNVSLLAALGVPSACVDASVCFSEGTHYFYSLGTRASCRYRYADRRVQFTYQYASGLQFGAGNVTITLVCGRTLGVPQVMLADPSGQVIELLWLTSAACHSDSSLAARPESKCYHVHPYTDPDRGIQAKFIDLTSLIRPEGYLISYSERPDSRFRISVCRPLETAENQTCTGSTACLVHGDDHFNVTAGERLGEIAGEDSNLHMEDGLLTVEYSVASGACEGARRTIKMHFLCPTGAEEELGPRVSFLTDSLCLLEIHWYTEFACGNSAFQTTGCQLTTAKGVEFDLSALNAVHSTMANETSSTGAPPQIYEYQLQLCSGKELNTLCGRSESASSIRVTQLNAAGECKSLGVGDGTLRFADGVLSMTFTLGDPCSSDFVRTSLVTFVCPEDLQEGDAETEDRLSFISEDACFYNFEWVTSYACSQETSGITDCVFLTSSGGSYNFAPLVGEADKNWVAVDDQAGTACYMLNPCGELKLAHDEGATSEFDYCRERVAPGGCRGASVCRVFINGSTDVIGRFDLQNESMITSVDSNVLTVRGEFPSSVHTAVVHYVCKVGDFTTAPVFVGISNEHFYEFHWTTFAACPSGVQRGENCLVTHKATGYTFNLTSLSSLSLLLENGSYIYNIAVCSKLGEESFCDGVNNSAVCQISKQNANSKKSLGLSSSTLIYEDGTLKLRYTNGSQCHHNGSPRRDTTVLFVCDSTAHTAVAGSVREVDYCSYVIEVRTKLACPPAYQATECIHIDTDGKSYDFSELSRSPNEGNWQARGPDGSIYFINLCQPLNRVTGCSPLASVCRVQTDKDTGHSKYTNIGLASTASFKGAGSSSGGTLGENRIRLTYDFVSLVAACEKLYTTIEFVCSNNTFNTEVGPRYASGGDEANPCQYTFLWETTWACPVQPVSSSSCRLPVPQLNYTFDLSPLTPSPPAQAQSYYSVSAEENVEFHLSLCTPLNHTCHGQDGVAVCQNASTGHDFSCGLHSTQRLQYFDGSLTLSYDHGDKCSRSNTTRSVRINLECDRSTEVGDISYIREESCSYSFVWPTALACLPLTLSCEAAGGKYDLTPLLQNQVWSVSEGADKGGYEYVLGGCRSLNPEDVPQCPQQPWMGACRYKSGAGAAEGEALGYVTGDLVEVGEGLLQLGYYNGDAICVGGRRSTVKITFQCAPHTASGTRSLVEFDSVNCVTQIQWVTEYACPRSSSNTDGVWVISDPITEQVYDLTKLSHMILTVTYNESATSYLYSVALNGSTVVCPRPGKDNSSIGACQTRVSDSHSHSLGLVNSTLSYEDGGVRVVYSGGDTCHNAGQPHRKSVILFECNLRDDDGTANNPILEVLPESYCEYTFVVHTVLVCHDKPEVLLECVLDGFHGLGSFLTLKAPEIPVPGVGHAHIAVCQSITPSNQLNSSFASCPGGTGACLVFINGTAVSLGKPSPHHPPVPLPSDTGVSLSYGVGDPCSDEEGPHYYHSTLLLVCNRNIPIGVPEFIEQNGCSFLFRWESAHACKINLPVTPPSLDECQIHDPASDFTYDFTTLVRSSIVKVTAGETTYYLQLCGSLSSPPVGCDRANTGVCRLTGGSHYETLVYAQHSFVVTSHSPHSIEVVFDSGTECETGGQWRAFVMMACSSTTNQMAPELVSDGNCELHFRWLNSSFCVGEETCAVVDPSSGHVYNLDALFSETWTGLVAGSSEEAEEAAAGGGGGGGGTFTMAVCRQLNPFSSGGNHCSSPAGICWHTPTGGHLNLGHMTSEITLVPVAGKAPELLLKYYEGDMCEGSTRHHTDVYLRCGSENTTPLLSSHGDNCSWVVVMETPLACPPVLTNSSTCQLNTSFGSYDFTPLSKPTTFSLDGGDYSVCLCRSSSCAEAAITRTSSPPAKLGTFLVMDVSSTLGGPRIFYTGGDTCSDGRQRSSWLFMECSRSEESFFLDQALSTECEQYFFWFTPYACLSEEISCSLSLEHPHTAFFNFNPLHSHDLAWTVTSGAVTYYINICGPVINTGSKGDVCSPEAAVCMKQNGQDAVTIAIADTQEIVPFDGSVRLQFSGSYCPAQPNATSRVYISMQCGIAGLKATVISEADCVYEFSWQTPFACSSSDDTSTSTDQCERISSQTGFTFDPSKLTSDYAVSVGGDTYHVSLCGPNPSCRHGNSGDAAVCVVGQGGGVTDIAHDSPVKFTVDAYWMLATLQHTIVLVQCQRNDLDNPDTPKSETLEFVNHVKTEDKNEFYYFKLYTTRGCEFTIPTEPPPPTVPPKTSGKNSSGGKAVAAIIIISAVATLALVLVIVLYKKQRRERVKNWMVKLVGVNAAETVRYHKVRSHDNEEEETALLDAPSDEEGTVDVGGGVEFNSQGTRTNETDDEELINL